MATSTAGSIKVVKDFTYRGVLRQWSNRYHFDNGAPADAAHWLTLANNVTTAEKAIHSHAVSDVRIVGVVGYEAGSEIPVYSGSYALSGTLSVTGGYCAPGDAAYITRFSTSSRTSKNHPLYLFNYFHGAITNGPSSGDYPYAAQKSALGTYAAAWITGFSDGVNTYHRCGPQSDLATGHVENTFITHRDFPRD
jgi:hypothetical protein